VSLPPAELLGALFFAGAAGAGAAGAWVVGASSVAAGTDSTSVIDASSIKLPFAVNFIFCDERSLASTQVDLGEASFAGS